LIFLAIPKFLVGVKGGGVARENNKNQGGKILLNNTQKIYSTDFTVWECSYSIGSCKYFKGGAKKIDLICIQLFAIVQH